MEIYNLSAEKIRKSAEQVMKSDPKAVQKKRSFVMVSLLCLAVLVATYFIAYTAYVKWGITDNKIFFLFMMSIGLFAVAFITLFSGIGNFLDYRVQYLKSLECRSVFSVHAKYSKRSVEFTDKGILVKTTYRSRSGDEGFEKEGLLEYSSIDKVYRCVGGAVSIVGEWVNRASLISKDTTEEGISRLEELLLPPDEDGDYDGLVNREVSLVLDRMYDGYNGEEVIGFLKGKIKDLEVVDFESGVNSDWGTTEDVEESKEEASDAKEPITETVEGSYPLPVDEAEDVPTGVLEEGGTTDMEESPEEEKKEN